MKIDINNPSQLLSHLLLEDVDLVMVVSETSKWKEDGIIEATCQFNGVDVTADVLEKVLQNFVKQIEDHCREKYDANNIDKLVEERANEIIKNHADRVLEKLTAIEYVLSDPHNIITPHWGREK
jgi:spore coat polysaccharide biosynthesis protein SpsF (cytidylyltransferase family)